MIRSHKKLAIQLVNKSRNTGYPATHFYAADLAKELGQLSRRIETKSRSVSYHGEGWIVRLTW